MNKFFSLLVFLSFNFVFSQKKFQYKDNHFPVKYILKNSNDTVRTRVQNIGIYSNKKFSPGTYINDMYVVDSLGNKIKVPQRDIAYMEITDLKNITRKIISSSTVLSKDIGLLETLYEGNKTVWYRHASSGNLSPYSPVIVYNDYMVFKSDNAILDLGVNGRYRQRLKQKFSAYPDILLLIDSWKTDEDMVKILDRFEKK